MQRNVTRRYNIIWVFTMIIWMKRKRKLTTVNPWDGNRNVYGVSNSVGILTVSGFHNRKLFWGHGITIDSPTNVETLNCTRCPKIISKSKMYVVPHHYPNYKKNHSIINTTSTMTKHKQVLVSTKIPRFNQALTEEQSETLLSFLTVPYMRIPPYVHSLRNKRNYCSTVTCSNLQAVLLEQGAWEIESENSNDNVPDLTRKSLGTPTGLLENELLTSRDVVMSPLIRILKFVINIAQTNIRFTRNLHVCASMFRLATILSAYEKIFWVRFETILLRFWDVDTFCTWRSIIRGRKGVGNVPMLTVLYAHLALILSVDGKNSNEEFLASAAFVRYLLHLEHYNNTSLTNIRQVRANNLYGQQFCNHGIRLETHNTDPSVIQDLVMKQLIMFLQSQGIRNISKQDLKKYLTGDPVWFVTEKSSIRVPIVGIQNTWKSYVIQQQSDRLVLIQSPQHHAWSHCAKFRSFRRDFFVLLVQVSLLLSTLLEKYNLKIDVQRYGHVTILRFVRYRVPCTRTLILNNLWW